MNIDKAMWHYRWYVYWLSNGRGLQPKYRENLCHYVRVLLFWAPVTWIDQHSRWDWGQVTAIGSLISIVGFSLYWLTVWALVHPVSLGITIGSIATAAIIFGLFYMSWRGLQGKDTGIDRTIDNVVDTVRLTWNYAVAKKRNICPFLTFIDAEVSSTPDEA